MAYQRVPRHEVRLGTNCRFEHARAVQGLHPLTVQHSAFTVRVLLIAWALQESTTMWLRTLLRATALPERVVVSSGLLSRLGLDTLRQQVQSRWSEACLQTCLPRLHRFLCSRPRRRGHQESTVRTWLEQRACAYPDRQQKAA